MPIKKKPNSKPTPKVSPASDPIWRAVQRQSAQRKFEPPQGLVALGEALRGTGFLQEPDPRDQAYPLGPIAGDVTGSLRGEYSPIWGLPPQLLNQGSTNSCVGHACAHFILAEPGTSVSIDPIEVWREAQKIDEYQNNDNGENMGTSIRAGFKVLQNRQLISGEYLWSQDATEVLRYLINRGPVVIGTKWYQGMLTPTDGIMSITGDAVGGHSCLLFGFSANRDAFLVANSWGPSWGISAKAFLPFDMLQELFKQGGTACSAVQV